MSLLKSKKRESTKPSAKGKPEVHDLKDAYIITQENGDLMVQTLGELPGKYWVGVIGPMMEMLQKTFRGNVKVTVDPNKPAIPLPDMAGKAPDEIPQKGKPQKSLEPVPKEKSE